ncbi:MAG: hypothetical protein IJ180_05380, partial [Bacteroidales bacterium]|nr:hypothetical protein [Bacteroidales bacterium]
NVSEKTLSLLEKMMSPLKKNRPQNMTEVLNLLQTTSQTQNSEEDNTTINEEDTLVNKKEEIEKENTIVKERNTTIVSSKYKVVKLKPKTKENKSKKILFIILIAVAIIITVLLIVFSINKTSYSESSSISATVSNTESVTEEVAETVEEIKDTTEEVIEKVESKKETTIPKSKNTKQNVKNETPKIDKYARFHGVDRKEDKQENKPVEPIVKSIEEVFETAKKQGNFSEIQKQANRNYGPAQIYLAKYYARMGSKACQSYKYAVMAKNNGYYTEGNNVIDYLLKTGFNPDKCN